MDTPKNCTKNYSSSDSAVSDLQMENLQIAESGQMCAKKKEIACQKSHQVSSKTTARVKSKKMKEEMKIVFPDIVSTATCSQLLIEFIKYLLYVKEQIPYQYNHLKSVVDRKKKWDSEKSKAQSFCTSISRMKAIAAERHFTKASQAVETLEMIFKHLHDEISSSSAVAILFGATIATPHEAYIVEFPQLFSSAPSSLPSRPCLTYLLRELVTSEVLLKMTSLSCRPSNIYILLRKPAATQTSWFHKKHLYTIPVRCNQVLLNFLQPLSAGNPKFKIYVESQSPPCPSPMCQSIDPHEPDDCPVEATQWFQAQNLVKGFKDCYIGNECATDVWMKI